VELSNSAQGARLKCSSYFCEDPKQVDLKKTWNPTRGFIFSKEFFKSWNHFDNEEFGLGSYRLIALKEAIINIVKDVSDSSSADAINKGYQARIFLGAALHTLQDFYAHSNFVELNANDRYEIAGFEGERLLCFPVQDIPKNFYPDGFNRNLVETQPNDPSIQPLYKNCSKPAVCDDRGKCSDNGEPTSPTDDPSKLLPNLKKLTSGYYFGVTIACRAPKGKTRHGQAVVPGPEGLSSALDVILAAGPGAIMMDNMNCPEGGLNKDEPGRPFHEEAKKIAIVASVGYLQTILATPELKSNLEAVKALMGITKQPEQVGSSYGDPHLITFDGFRYSFQTAGEFVLARSQDGYFTVQARQTPISSSLSLNSAVALQVGEDIVGFYAKDFPDGNSDNPLRLNGKSVLVNEKLELSGGGSISNSSGTYIIDFPSGEKVVISRIKVGENTYFNVTPYVFKGGGRYEGLLGDSNGNSKDDLKVRGGGSFSSVVSTYGDMKNVLQNVINIRLPGQLDVAEKLYFDQINKDFANSWRVTPEESIFEYPAGKTTANFTDKGFPQNYLKLDMLTAQQIDKARTACEAQKLDVNLMEGCLFDVGFGGLSEFARATAQINGYVDLLNQAFPGFKAPKLPTIEEVKKKAIDKAGEEIKKILPIPKILKCIPFFTC
jgi:von Willebrand factor type D domain/Heterokaryon incompatibility protein Het-C